jgi:very-short-patch-repair endonuclease
VQADELLALAAAESHGVFNVAMLDQLGIPHADRHYRTETRRWVRLHSGVYRIAGAPITWRGELLAACWAGGTRAVASHRSAAALWDLPGGQRVLEITCPRWRRARHEGLIVHESTRLDSIDVTMVDRIPSTSIERMILDMCGTGGSGLADLLIDSALRRRLTTIERLLVTRDRLAKRGRRGGANFRSAMDRRDASASLPESEPERMLARYLVANGLPAPVHQHVVRNARNRFVARVDLAYPDHGVVLEYDSATHHTGTIALERDNARRNAMTSLGLLVVVATAADLRDRARRLSAQIEPLLRTGR